MKIRIYKNAFLHLGTPWRDAHVHFPHAARTDRPVTALWGLSAKSIGFIGWIRLGDAHDITAQH